MRYRLGIDLGTASIGAVALKLNEQGIPLGAPWHAVRIFQEPLEKGQAGLKPKKAARRLARQQRRQIDRRARRLRLIAHLAPLLGLDPKRVPPHPGPGFSALRARAARERIELDDLLRVLLRLAKRRGYKGEFRTTGKDSETGVVKSGSGKLAEAMAELARQRQVGRVTLGEYLHYRHAELGLPIRMKLDREDVDDLYALRGMVEDEFEQIWQTQAKHHPVLNERHEGRPIKEHFQEAIFFQRPLKSPAPMVGNCSLEQNLPRAPRTQPAAQAFRIEKTLADLRWGMGKRVTGLSPAQKTEIRRLLNDPDELRTDGTITFKKIYQALEEAGCPRPDTRGLNLDRSSREELKGNTTLKAFQKFGLLTQWQALDERTQIQVINFLADLGSPEQLDNHDWHQHIRKANAKGYERKDMRQFSQEMIDFINQLRACGKFDRLSKMGFEGGRSAYSIKALKKLTEWMQAPEWRDDPGKNPRIDEDAAVRECYPEHFKKSGLTSTLPEPPKTGNDVVDGALRELQKVVNQCIAKLDEPPAEIIVETTRELGAGPERRNEWERRAAANQKRRKQAAKKISEAGEIATGTKILRYLLWGEQEENCPYCERKIGIHEALNGAATHFEHILPRSLTQVGRKRSELVLAHRECNSAKGDRTPWQAWGNDPQRWAQIEGRAQRFEELGKKHYGKDRPLAMAYFRKARLLTLKDHVEEVMNDESIAGFADRQLHQSSWIAKAATAWLGSICGNVFASRGEMTAGLRAAWRLDTVIPEVRYEEGYRVFDTDGKPISKEDFDRFRKQWEGRLASSDNTDRTERRIDKRIDHRHHLIDALTIAQTSRGLYQKMARRYVEETKAIQRGEKKRRDWGIEPPLGNVREIALELVRNCNLTHKPDRLPNGRFFKDTAYGAAHDEQSDQWRLTLRCRLTDLIDNQNNKAKTRSNLSTIVSAEVRQIVLQAFDERIAQGMNPKEALTKPIEYPRYRTTIHKVRCYQKQGRGFLQLDGATLITHRSRQGEHSKRVVSDGYACLDVITENNNLKEVQLVTLDQFQRSKKPRGATHFFKGDTVIDIRDGKRYLIHQFNVVHGGSIFMAPIHETRLISQLKPDDGRKIVSGKSLLKLKPEV